MGTLLFRATREPDSLYVEWDTSADRWTWIFDSREELVAHLEEEARFRHPFWGDDGHMHIPADAPAYEARHLKETLQRLDLQGTSSRLHIGGWDDSSIQVDAPKCPKNHFWELPRDRLQAYLQAYLDDRDEEAHAMLIAVPYD